MIAPTHLAFGLFFTLFLSSVLGYTLRVDLWVYLAILLGSILPDIDTPLSLVGRLFSRFSHWLDRRFGHRTITHSFLGWLVCSGLVLPLIFIKWEYPFFFSLAYLSHLILDMANVQGITFFWPDKKRDVLGKPEQRLLSGDKSEVTLIVLFLVLAVLSLPLSKYGLRNSLGYLLGDHRSASAILLRSDKVSYLDFTALVQATNRQVAGKALILERVGDQYFIIDFNRQIRTIGTGSSVDLLGMTERIDYTDIPIRREQLEFTAQSYPAVLAGLPDQAYLSGTLELPPDYQVQVPLHSKTLVLKGNLLELRYASLTELKKLKPFRLLSPEGESARSALAAAQQQLMAVYARLNNDGLTPLGRTKLGIDHTKDPKYLQALTARDSAAAAIRSLQVSAAPWQVLVNVRYYPDPSAK